MKMIMENYRCPRCGEEKENQALLMRNDWLRNMFRSASNAYRSFGQSWDALFSSVEDDESSTVDELGALWCCSPHNASHTTMNPVSPFSTQLERAIVAPGLDMPNAAEDSSVFATRLPRDFSSMYAPPVYSH